MNAKINSRYLTRDRKLMLANHTQKECYFRIAPQFKSPQHSFNTIPLSDASEHIEYSNRTNNWNRLISDMIIIV